MGRGVFCPLYSLFKLSQRWKLTLCIPETLCYAFRGLFWTEWLKIQLATMSYGKLNGRPSLGSLISVCFHSLCLLAVRITAWIQAFSCWALFMPCCCCSFFLSSRFTWRPVNKVPFSCWGLTTICPQKVKIDFERWTDCKLDGGGVT